MRGKPKKRARRRRPQPDGRNAGDPFRCQHDRLDHLADEQRVRLPHGLALVGVTPERAAVVEDELDPAVGNDRVGRACRRALEQPVFSTSAASRSDGRYSAYRIARFYFAAATPAAALNVPVSGTPIGPTGM